MIVKDDKKITTHPLVTVQVFAYNKEKYIRECLDSIVNQKTIFEYEIIVSVNPGTDNTNEICLEYQRKYPGKIILVLREENMGLFYNYFRAEEMSRGKYIARCDGDDYWCDEEKIQKQLDLLESNPNYGLCYTPTRCFYEDTQSFGRLSLPCTTDDFKSLLLVETVQQPTVMYRRDLVQEYFREIRPEGRDWDMEDTPRTLWFAWNSKIARINEVTAVYRVIKNSWSHQSDYIKQEKYHKSILDIRLFFYERYCPGERDLLVPLYNDYYDRNIKAAYNSKNFTALWKNLLKYKYDGFNHAYRHLCILLKLIVKIIIKK